MKKIVIISFATKEFKKAQKKLKNSIKRFMSTDVEVRTYAPRDIDKNFKKENFYLIESKRGFGYWLWKPYFIDKTIKTLKDDDIVVYLDSGVELISNPDPLLKLLDELPLALFKTHCHFNKDWTKRDAFVLMDVNFEECAHTEQVAGGYQLYKVCKQSRDFVEQYLKYCLDPRILSDDMNTLEQQNYDGFRDHRHDQSVLSLLSWKYKYKVFRDPSQFGNSFITEEDTYSQIFNHHRIREPKFSLMKLIKQFLSKVKKIVKGV